MARSQPTITRNTSRTDVMRLQAEVSRLAADVKDTQSSVVTVQSSVTNLSISDITGLQAALDGKVNVP